MGSTGISCVNSCGASAYSSKAECDATDLCITASHATPRFRHRRELGSAACLNRDVSQTARLRLEVLQWIVERISALSLLGDDFEGHVCLREHDTEHLDLLAELVGRGDYAKQFRATCETMLCLAQWGGLVAAWLKGCPCHGSSADAKAQHCRLRGRRAFDLAGGKAW